MKTNKPGFLEFWNSFLRHEAWQKKMEEWRKLPTERLKELWDAFDGDAEENQPGYFWPSDGPHIEDVHALLNERGEGSYCAT
jgi:hypothetical protein